MTPTQQSRRNGTGDCVRACIATLLDLPLNHVPDFTEKPEHLEDHPTGYPVWYLMLQKWLAGKGYFFLEVSLKQDATWNPLPLPVYAILIGQRTTEIPSNDGPSPSTESVSCRHAIVGKCEGQSFIPVYDPLGGNPFTSLDAGAIEAACFLVPIDPSLQVRLGKSMDNIVRLARQLPQRTQIEVSILHESAESLGLMEIGIAAMTREDGVIEFSRDSIKRDGPSKS